MQLPTTSISISVPMRQRKASSGVQTIGSPRTLKLVLTSTGQPVFALNALSKAWNRDWFAVDGLHARRIIDMGDRRDLGADDFEPVQAVGMVRAIVFHAAALSHVGDQQHVGRRPVELEPVGDIFCQYGRREGTEAFPIFDLQIERPLHFAVARVAENGAVAERARSELHAALEPADGTAIGERLRRPLEQRGFILHDLKVSALGGERRRMSSSSYDGPRYAPDIPSPALGLRATFVIVIGHKRGAERAAGIARGRLHPDLLEFAVAQDFAIGDTIERHAAGQAEIPLRIFRRQTASEGSITSSRAACTEAAMSMCVA